MYNTVTKLTLLVLVLSMGFALAQTSPMVVADNVATGSPLYYNHASNIARTSDGQLVAVWNSPTDQVVFSKYDPSFMTWSPASAISNAGDRAYKAGIDADNNGNLFCVWQQRESSGEGYAIFFTKYDGTDWSTPVNLTGNDVENEEASVVVDDQNNIFVAWNTDAEPDSAEYVLCIKSTDAGQSWSDPDTLSSADGVIGGTSTTSGRPFLAKATGGKMVCAWHEEPDGHPDREVFISQYDGSQWMDEHVVWDKPDSANSMYATIAANSSDMLYMAYISFGNYELLLKKKAWNDSEWSETPDTLITDPQAPYKPFMGIDDNDNIYLVYRQDILADTLYDTEEIAYITSGDDGVSWSEPVVLSRPNHDAGYLTLAPRIRESGVDVLWREGTREMVDDPDTSAIVYGHIDLLETALDKNYEQSVQSFKLAQNYPNPFNPATEIEFNIAKNGQYELAVYNLLGQKIRTLKDGQLRSGAYTVKWDGTNELNKNVASGVYFYRLEGKNINLSKKMILIR